MEQKELCQWLRDNSAGTYRPSAEAADEIERLQKAWESEFRQSNENGGRAAQLQIELDIVRLALKELADATAETISRGIAHPRLYDLTDKAYGILPANYK